VDAFIVAHYLSHPGLKLITVITSPVEMTGDTAVLYLTACVCLLWAPAQRKRATMLYFANVFIYLFFMAALFSGPG